MKVWHKINVGEKLYIEGFPEHIMNTCVSENGDGKFSITIFGQKQRGSYHHLETAKRMAEDTIKVLAVRLISGLN